MLTRNRPSSTAELFTRAIPVASSTWNAEALTVDVVHRQHEYVDRSRG